MDALKKLPQLILRYKYAVLVLLFGVALMLIPAKSGEQTAAQDEISCEPDLSTELAAILAEIDGVGEVRVMLTVAAGEQFVHEKDEKGNVVIITDKDRGEAGLCQQTLSPVYKGAIIVCAGADSASVRLAVVEAVANVTGLPTDRISVLKMK